MRTRLFSFTIDIGLLAVCLAGCSLFSPPQIYPTEDTSSLVATQVSLMLTATSGSVPVNFPEATATSAPAITATPAATSTGEPVALPSATPTQAPPSPTATQAPPTATPQPPTPAPTATSTPNPRAKADAAYLSTSPDIDGVWDEWTTTQYPLTSVVWGYSNWAIDKDLKASYRAGWDSKYLYLAVKVHDQKYVQNATGADLYKGDSIEVLLSTNPNADSSSLGLMAADYQLGISPGKGEIGKDMEAYLWFPQNKAGKLTNIAIGAVPMSDGYRIEMAIPWSVFSMTPSRGQVLGFAVSVSSNNDPKTNVQQVLISSEPRRSLGDPTTWGQLTLK